MMVTCDLDVVAFITVRVVAPMWQMGKGSHGNHKYIVIVAVVLSMIVVMEVEWCHSNSECGIAKGEEVLVLLG